jgi:nicotinamidase-related amidase
MTSQTALVVVDVQDGIANSTDGVPDAGEITHAISSIVRLARLHDQTEENNRENNKSIEILFVQHDDKDPDDPLYRGKATWNLLFPPRQDVETERLVSKNVGM